MPLTVIPKICSMQFGLIMTTCKQTVLNWIALSNPQGLTKRHWQQPEWDKSPRRISKELLVVRWRDRVALLERAFFHPGCLPKVPYLQYGARQGCFASLWWQEDRMPALATKRKKSQTTDRWSVLHLIKGPKQWKTRLLGLSLLTHKVNSSSNGKTRKWTAVNTGNTFCGWKVPEQLTYPREDTDGRVGRSASCLAKLRYPKSLCGPMKIFNFYVKPILVLGWRTWGLTKKIQRRLNSWQSLAADSGYQYWWLVAVLNVPTSQDLWQRKLANHKDWTNRLWKVIHAENVLQFEVNLTSLGP